MSTAWSEGSYSNITYKSHAQIRVSKESPNPHGRLFPEAYSVSRGKGFNAVARLHGRHRVSA